MRTLFTVQSEEAWRRAESRGFLRGDGRYVRRSFRPAYRWLMGEMRARGIGGRSFPVWAWDDDVHFERVATDGSPRVAVAFEVPESCVLASEFHLWSAFILNGCCVPDEDDETGGDMAESWKRSFDPLVAASLLETVVPVWQFVVDRVPLRSVLSARPLVAPSAR